MTARELIETAGWFEARRVSIVEAVEAARENGYGVWPELEAALAEFDGLTITSGAGDRTLWIDAARAVAFADPDWVDVYAAAAGVDLVPIGGYSHMMVLSGRGGAYYGGFDTEFGKVGGCFEEAVERLLIGSQSGFLSRIDVR